MPDESMRLLTIGEVANIFSVHKNTVRVWGDSGVLPVIRLGNRRDRRFRQKDVAAYINKNYEGGEEHTGKQMIEDVIGGEGR